MKKQTYTVHKTIWALLATIALLSLLYSYFILQRHYGFLPCVYCVSIRFYIMLTAFVAIFGVLFPQYSILLQCMGYYALGQALWNAYSFYNVLHTPSKLCPSIVYYPFGLPLDTWFPEFFAPTALCKPYPFIVYNLSLEHIALLYIVGLLCLLLFETALTLYKNSIKRR